MLFDPGAWAAWLFTLMLGATVSAAAERSAPAPRLRVLSYNVNYGGDEPAVLDAIADADADVVLLQETTPAWERALRRRFASRYDHIGFHHWRRYAGGLAVLSRHPIERDQLLPPAESWFPAQRLIIATPLGRVELLNLHLRPAIDQGDWVRGFFTTPPIRRREIEAYWKALSASPDDELPRIIAGDFNEEPGATALAYLAEQGLARADTGATQTWEWQGVYRDNPIHLKMKLDHIFVSPQLAVRDATVLPGAGSDHRPIVATLEPAAPAAPPSPR
jgi:endonuclease/exonuclease/phosphatase (EEP) superfamily protein YafD